MSRKIKNFCSRSLPELLCLALLLPLLSGCGGEQASRDGLRIGVALYAQEDTFITSLTQSLERLAQAAESETGEKITLFISDARSNQTTQMDQVDRFLNRGCDVLCVNIVDRTAAAVVVDKAQAEGVPLIFFNRQPVDEDIQRWDQIYYVGASAQESGELQGQLVLEAWRKDQETLDRNGDGVLQYAMLEGEQGHQDALIRTEYSVKVLTDAGVSVEKLVSDTASWNRSLGAGKMSQWLEQSYGSQIEVLFSNNDDMALGAIDAMRELDWPDRPLVVGIDGTVPALEAMETGELYATVKNDEAGQAKAIIDLALALYQGEDLAQTVDLTDGQYVWLPYQKVTQETLSDFIRKGD